MAAARRHDRPDLTGLRVLVVEDAMMVAFEIKDTLSDHGCQVVGPVKDVARAIVLTEQDLDGALLDVNLDGEFCYPIADALRRRNVPFAFLTGYADGSIIPKNYRSVPRLPKPVDFSAVVAFVDQNFR